MRLINRPRIHPLNRSTKFRLIHPCPKIPEEPENSHVTRSTCLTSANCHTAAEAACPHVQSFGHERVRVADFPDRPSISRYARAFRRRQVENTLQRLDIRYLLAEHRGQLRGRQGTAEGDTIPASCDHCGYRLSTTTTQLPDRSEETWWPCWSER